MSTSIGNALFLMIMISSCTRIESRPWTIPLHSVDANLIINLPSEFNSMKESVHLSDCKPCGKYQTILADFDFVNKVEDTTGFFIPWLADTCIMAVFYIDEELYPEPYVSSGISNEESLRSKITQIKNENKRTNIFKQKVDNNTVMLAYETFDKFGVTASRKIDCLKYIDEQSIGIHYIQYRNFKNELLESVWSSLLEMNVEKEK
ncbi:MAG: hypothetical protein ACOH13_02255 [Flavobacteriales bacterium]